MRRVIRLLYIPVLILIGVECASFVVLQALALRYKSRAAPERQLPVYLDVPWADVYWREHRLNLSNAYENYPNGLWRFPAFKGETINVDANGVRKTAYSKCEGNEPTVYVFGSSSVWGQGSPDWETIPSYLAKLFADDGRDACVINYGSDAWTSSESVIKLIQELKRSDARRPNFVISLDSCNDTLATFYVHRPDWPFNFMGQKDWLDTLAVIHKGSFYYLTATNTATLIDTVIKRIRGPIPSSMPADPDGLARKTIDIYLNNVRIVDGLSRSFGFQYEFFWLPMFAKDAPALSRLAVEKTFPLIQQAARDHIHDLSGLYGENLSIDICHVSPEGNKLIASKVYETIRHDRR